MSDTRLPGSYEPAKPEDLTEETIRDWGKRILHDWAAHQVGEGGWDKLGACAPEHLIDCIFSQIQVTLLGYARIMEEADAKRKQVDQMLRVRK
jgi:hypothetical protein